MNHSESNTQQAFIQWCNLHLKKYPALNLAFAIPNGGKRSVITAAILKREGVRAGVLDWTLPVPTTKPFTEQKSGLWIEFKHGKNKLTPAQAEYAMLLRHYGHEVHVCYTVDAAIEITINYLAHVI